MKTKSNGLIIELTPFELSDIRNAWLSVAGEKPIPEEDFDQKKKNYERIIDDLLISIERLGVGSNQDLPLPTLPQIIMPPRSLEDISLAINSVYRWTYQPTSSFTAGEVKKAMADWAMKRNELGGNLQYVLGILEAHTQIKFEQVQQYEKFVFDAVARTAGRDDSPVHFKPIEFQIYVDLIRATEMEPGENQFIKAFELLNARSEVVQKIKVLEARIKDKHAQLDRLNNQVTAFTSSVQVLTTNIQNKEKQLEQMKASAKQQIEDQIKGLEQEIQDLTFQMNNPSGPANAVIQAEIDAKQAQVAAFKQQLSQQVTNTFINKIENELKSDLVQLTSIKETLEKMQEEAALCVKDIGQIAAHINQLKERRASI